MEVFGVRRYLRNKVRSIFDGRRHSPRVLKEEQDTVYTLKVSLEELYNSTSKLICISREVKCSTCLGKGTMSSSSNECSRCQGSGEITNAVYPEEGVVIAEQQFCNMCKGTGRDISEEDPCPECKGQTVLVELQKLEVNVDKGMQNGHEIRFPGEADASPFTKEPGGVVFVLEEMQHPKFKRVGDDLFVEHTLTLGETLSGFQFTLTHLDNRQLLIEIQPKELVVSGGSRKTKVIKEIKDEGMPIHERPFARGNLYIRFTME